MSTVPASPVAGNATDTEVFDNTYYDLLAEVSALQDCVFDNAYRQSPVYRAFRKLFPEDDEAETPRIFLSEAWEEFSRLSASERQLVLNGWKVEKRKLRRPDILDYQQAMQPTTFLVVNAGTAKKGADQADHFSSNIDQLFDDRCDPIAIHVRMGVTKDVALAALKGAVKRIEADWESIIDDSNGIR